MIAENSVRFAHFGPSHNLLHPAIGTTVRPSPGTSIPFLNSFEGRYGVQSSTVCADSGYGSEMNYEHMVSGQITPGQRKKFSPYHIKLVQYKTCMYLCRKCCGL